MKIICLLGFFALACATSEAQTNSYSAAPIVDNTQDQYLINPWGISRPADRSLGENEWWVSDNGTGVSTLYSVNKSGSQSLSPLVITIPTASGGGVGSPTGTAYNGTGGPGPGANNFTFATLDGTISSWNAGTKPPPGGTSCYECHVANSAIVVNHSSSGASYFGLALATNAATGLPVYYATNFNGNVEAYDAATFAPVILSGKFSDKKIPTSYRPYGIQAIGKEIWVSFFNRTAGGGYVDAFDTDGKLKVRLETGSFSEPWGLAQAPSNFGLFSKMILVGNTTSGMIGAYNPKTGAFAGFLEDSSGQAIVIPGLWGIGFGDGNKKDGPTNALYYANGGSTYSTGVFGVITAN
jgi:uncharacterized protein (TIGR03118 family)